MLNKLKARAFTLARVLIISRKALPLRELKSRLCKVSQTISHDGVVKAVQSNQVSVLIVQSSACGGCAAKSLCTSAESKEKMIQVAVPDGSLFHEGQAVIVLGRLSDGLSAAALAYALPLVLLLAVLVIVLALGYDESLAALAAILSLVPYYGILYLFRSRLQRRFSFRLKINEN